MLSIEADSLVIHNWITRKQKTRIAILYYTEIRSCFLFAQKNSWPFRAFPIVLQISFPFTFYQLHGAYLTFGKVIWRRKKRFLWPSAIVHYKRHLQSPCGMHFQMTMHKPYPCQNEQQNTPQITLNIFISIVLFTKRLNTCWYLSYFSKFPLFYEVVSCVNTTFDKFIFYNNKSNWVK